MILARDVEWQAGREVSYPLQTGVCDCLDGILRLSRIGIEIAAHLQRLDMKIPHRGPRSLFASPAVSAVTGSSAEAAALEMFEGEPVPGLRCPDSRNALLQPCHRSGTVAARKSMGQLSRDNPIARLARQSRFTTGL